MKGSWALLALLGLCGCQPHAEEPHFTKPVKPAAAEPEEAVQAEPAATTPSATPAPSNAAAKPVAPARLQRSPSSPDPEAGEFTLQEATAGLAGKGALHATITTNLGSLECALFDDKAPATVANFVGLARGKRPFWDAHEAAWVTRPLYDGTTFHRVIPGFMIQGGDYLGTGAGDIGYTIDDELHPSLKHDRAGLLCMANKGPDTNGAQFFITDAAAPHLTAMKSYSIFGECKPLDLISKIANVPKAPGRPERPEPQVTIESVTITRK